MKKINLIFNLVLISLLVGSLNSVVRAESPEGPSASITTKPLKGKERDGFFIGEKFEVSAEYFLSDLSQFTFFGPAGWEGVLNSSQDNLRIVKGPEKGYEQKEVRWDIHYDFNPGIRVRTGDVLKLEGGKGKSMRGFNAVVFSSDSEAIATEQKTLYLQKNKPPVVFLNVKVLRNKVEGSQPAEVRFIIGGNSGNDERIDYIDSWELKSFPVNEEGAPIGQLNIIKRGQPKTNEFQKQVTYEYSQPGEYKVQLIVTDRDGETNSSGIKRITIEGKEPEKKKDLVDETPPFVTVSGWKEEEGWSSESAEVGITCTDNGGDCKEESFRLFKGSGSLEECPSSPSKYNIKTIPFAIHSHQWFCALGKDQADNVGYSEPIEFKIDQQSPTISFFKEKEERDVIEKGNSITLKWKVFDKGGSGFDRTKVKSGSRTLTTKRGAEGSITISPSTNRSYYIDVFDKAGNKSTSKKLQVKVEEKPKWSCKSCEDADLNKDKIINTFDLTSCGKQTKYSRESCVECVNDYWKEECPSISPAKEEKEPERSITVLSPNDGEEWQIGETYRVSWDSVGVDSVHIHIYNRSRASGTGIFNYITSDNATVPANTGYYEWTIKERQLPIGDADKFKIKVMDADSDVQDFTDGYFSILEAAKEKPEVSVSLNPTSPIGEIVSGKGVDLFRFDLWPAGEDISIKTMELKIVGGPVAMTHFKLIDAQGNQVGSVQEMTSQGEVSWEPQDYVVPEGQRVKLAVTADVWQGSGEETFNIRVVGIRAEGRSSGREADVSGLPVESASLTRVSKSDETPPTINSFKAKGQTGQLTITEGDKLNFTWQATDDQSGIDGAGVLKAKLTNNCRQAKKEEEECNWGSIGIDKADTPLGEGIWLYGIHVYDNKGNMTTESDGNYTDEGVGRIKVVVKEGEGEETDKEAPRTSIDPNGSNWVRGNAKFKLSCNDGDGAGCDQTAYEIADKEFPCTTRQAMKVDRYGKLKMHYNYDLDEAWIPCASGKICEKIVCYASKDNQGNEEEVKESPVFKIDEMGPEVNSFTVSPKEVTLGQDQEIDINWQISDEGSGLSETYILRCNKSNESDCSWNSDKNDTVKVSGCSSSNYGYGYREGKPACQDTLTSPGTYWYGAQVYDNVDNFGNEGGAEKVTVEEESKVGEEPEPEPEPEENASPVLESIDNITVARGEVIEFKVKANDSDNDPLTYSVTPSTMAFNPNSQQYRWDTSQVRDNELPWQKTYTFKVFDNQGGKDEEEVVVRVEPEPQPKAPTAPKVSSSSLQAVSPRSGESGVSLRPTFKWKTPGNQNYYHKIQTGVSTREGIGCRTGLLDLGLDTASFNCSLDQELEPGQDYQWRIWARYYIPMEQGGGSDKVYSDWVNFTTRGAPEEEVEEGASTVPLKEDVYLGQSYDNVSLSPAFHWESRFNSEKDIAIQEGALYGPADSGSEYLCQTSFKREGDIPDSQECQVSGLESNTRYRWRIYTRHYFPDEAGGGSAKEYSNYSYFTTGAGQPVSAGTRIIRSIKSIFSKFRSALEGIGYQLRPKNQ